MRMLSLIIWVVALSGCQVESPPATPEEIVARAYADSIKLETQYFNRTMEFIPPNATDIKMVGNGWITYVWNGQCFFMSDQYHNVAKSAAMITTMPIGVCNTAHDLRRGPLTKKEFNGDQY